MHHTCKKTLHLSLTGESWMTLRGDHCEVNFYVLAQKKVLMQLNHHERPNKEATIPSGNVGSSSDCENRATGKTLC